MVRIGVTLGSSHHCHCKYVVDRISIDVDLIVCLEVVLQLLQMFDGQRNVLNLFE